jgi:hypothetical protein
MDLKPGSRWRSAVSDVEVVVVRPPSEAGVLACGGAPMIPHGAAKPGAGDAAPAGQSQAGKRYHDAESGLEALCSKGGAGELAFGGRALAVRDAKKLPASD